MKDMIRNAVRARSGAPQTFQFEDGQELDFSKGVGCFPNRPTSLEMEKIREFVQRTGRPEEHPQVCLTKSDPSHSHMLVGLLDISMQARHSDHYAWCTFCQTWKFADGRWMWTPEDGALRPIGRDCAAEHLGEARSRQMDEDYDRRVQQEAAQDFLLETWPTVPERIEELQVFYPMASALQEQHKGLVKKAPMIAAILNRIAHVKGGSLAVARKRDLSAGGPSGFRGSIGSGASEYTTDVLGRMVGLKFLNKSFTPVRDLERLLATLRLQEPYADEDVMLDTAAGLSDTALIATADALRRLLGKVDRFIENLEDASRFLTVGNLHAIAVWLNDPDCPMRGTAKISGTRLRIRGLGELGTLLEPIPQIRRLGATR